MKNCPFCNAELPDETSFCLNCSSALNSREEPSNKTPKAFLHKKAVALCIAIFFIFSLSVISAYRIKKIPLKPQDTNTHETVFVPVTQKNGETVTDSQGDTIYEAVIVETTTKKATFPDIISGIINKDKDKDKKPSDNNNDATASGTPPGYSPITEPTSNRPSESNPSEPNSSDTQPAETEPTTGKEIIIENPEDVFEFEPYEKSTTKISITKYKGNASFVTVPDYINGLMVVEIKQDAFINNSKIKTIDIIKGERSYIWLKSKCFNNLSSLTTVNLYDNDLGMYGDFAVDCPIKDFNITFWQYKFVNGAIYSYNSKNWEFKTFCGNPCYTTLTLEPWCKTISNDNNLYNAKNLKVINAHKDVTYIPTFSLDYNNSLEAINVESGNERYLSKDGVLFKQRYTSSGYVNSYDAYYPASKRDKTFEMPQKDGFTFYLNANTSVVNPYVEEIYLPLNSSIGISASSSSFPNLKKLYFAKGNPCYDETKFVYTCEIVLY